MCQTTRGLSGRPGSANNNMAARVSVFTRGSVSKHPIFMARTQILFQWCPASHCVITAATAILRIIAALRVAPATRNLAVSKYLRTLDSALKVRVFNTPRGKHTCVRHNVNGSLVCFILCGKVQILCYTYFIYILELWINHYVAPGVHMLSLWCLFFIIIRISLRFICSLIRGAQFLTVVC